MTKSFRTTMARLESAQKGAARSAPAYSRFVNRRIGRHLAALAYGRGLTPNQVTASARTVTFSGIAALPLRAPSWRTVVASAGRCCSATRLDSADGQLARLRASGSPAGEWLDHVSTAPRSRPSRIAPRGRLLHLLRTP